MLAVLIPAGVAAWWLFFRKPKALTEKHQEVITKALESTNAPAIQKVAVAFGAEGFSEVSAHLRKRAALIGRDASTLRRDQEDFVQALTAPVRSGESRYTREVAERFHKRGMSGSAKCLMQFCKGYERAMSVPPVFLNAAGNPEHGEIPPEAPPTGEADLPAPIDHANPFSTPPDAHILPPLGTLIEDLPEAQPGDSGGGGGEES
jgi:hypothetical protein